MHKSRNNSGFSLVSVVVALAVVAAVGGTGVYVYQHRHKTSKSVAATQPQTNPAQQTSTSTTPAKPVDPYAGWKSYCDTVYKYCFKYPADWTLSGVAQAAKLGDISSATVTNPASTVVLSYRNPDTHDSQPLNVTVTDVIVSPSSQDLTVVGDYYPTSGLVGNYAVRYAVADSALLKTYPLTKGQQTQFPNNPKFSDPGTTNYGMFTAAPGAAINTLDDLHAWMAQADTNAGLLVLKSLARQ